MTVITSEELKSHVSANVSRLLAERGMSVYRLAKLTGEPQNTVYRIVRGENEPGSVLLARIAEALGVAVDVLLATPKKTRNSA